MSDPQAQRNLVAAIILQAVEDIEGKNNATWREIVSAVCFIRNEDPFEYYCVELGLDPDAVREKVRDKIPLAIERADRLHAAAREKAEKERLARIEERRIDASFATAC